MRRGNKSWKEVLACWARASGGGLGALECGLDFRAAEPDERFGNSAVIQLPMLRRLPSASHLSRVSFLSFSP